MLTHVLVLLTLPIAIASAMQPHDAERPRIASERLANGLEVVYAPDSQQSRVTVAIAYDAGSRVEHPSTVGIGHLVEHLLFRGTQRHPDLLTEYANRGASKNAQTWFDHTVFFTSLPAADSNVAWVMEVEADRMRNVVLTPPGFEAERRVVQTEIVTTKDTFAEHVLLEAVRRAAMGSHPYARSIGGTSEQVGAITLDQARAFYKERYHPAAATVVVTGRFSVDSARAAARKFFAPIDAPPPSAERVVPLPARGAATAVRVPRSGDVSRAVVMAAMPAAIAPEFATATVMQAVLSGASSPLRAIARRHGLGRVTANLDIRRQAGELAIVATIPDSVDPAVVVAEVREAIGQLRRDTLPAVEVQRAVRRYLQGNEDARTTDLSVAVSLAEWSQRGDWNGRAKLLERVRAVTNEDLRRFAQRWMADSQLSVGWSVRKSSSDGEVVPAAAGPEDRLLELEKKVVRLTLPGGLRVAMLPDSSIARDVQGVLFMHAGNARVATSRATGTLLGRMLRRGAEGWTVSLEDTAASLDAKIVVGGSGVGARAQFSAPRARTADVIAIVAQILREPNLSQENFDDTRRAAVGSLTELRTMPGLTGFETMERLIDGAVQTPEAASPEQQVRELQALTLADVRDFHGRYYGMSRAEVAIVGNFDPAVVEQALRRGFGGWSAAEPYVGPAIGPLPSQLRNVVAIPGITGATFFAGIPLALDSTHREAAALQVAAFVAGGIRNNASRLRARVRNESGIAYTVALQLVERPYATGRPLLLLDINTTPQQVERVEAMVREELERIARDGLTEDEIARAKGGLLGGLESRYQNPGWLIEQLQFGLFWQRTLAHHVAYAKALDALTAADVAAAIRKHLDVGRMHTLVYVPSR